MSHTMDFSRQAAEHTEPTPASRERDDTELDLERLVWDPEYRAAMRPLLRRAS